MITSAALQPPTKSGITSCPMRSSAGEPSRVPPSCSCGTAICKGNASCEKLQATCLLCAKFLAGLWGIAVWTEFLPQRNFGPFRRPRKRAAGAV